MTDKSTKTAVVVGHTPGNWRSETFDSGIAILAPADPVGSIEVARVTPFYREARRNEANARLIAAAPDLLEACRILVAGLCHFDGPTLGDVEKAEAAIAKATGVTP